MVLEKVSTLDSIIFFILSQEKNKRLSQKAGRSLLMLDVNN